VGSQLRLDYFPNSQRTDLKHASWLLRLSYMRYTLKTASDPRGLLDRETEELHLSPQFNKPRFD